MTLTPIWPNDVLDAPFEGPGTEEMLKVIPKLTEPHRFYHNLEHICRMLQAHQLWKHHFKPIWTMEEDTCIYLQSSTTIRSIT